MNNADVVQANQTLFCRDLTEFRSKLNTRSLGKSFWTVKFPVLHQSAALFNNTSSDFVDLVGSNPRLPVRFGVGISRTSTSGRRPARVRFWGQVKTRAAAYTQLR